MTKKIKHLSILFEFLCNSTVKDPGNNERELHMRGLKVGHIRLYIGLEESELLIEDIKQALDRAYGKLDRVR